MQLQQWDTFTLAEWDIMLLDGATTTTGANTVAYDAGGNRLTKTDQVTSGVTTYTYSNGNELLTSQDASGITTYTYDANGNRETITDPSFTVTHNEWDPENRLIEVSEGLDVTEYLYNGDGLLVEKQTDNGATVTRYVYDGTNLVQEQDASGITEAAFTYQPMAYGLSISQHRDRDSHFYHFDGTKSVRRLTDDTGVEADKYAFDAFGNETSSSGSTANSQRYKGEYLMYHRDPDAGPEVAYALHHRHYEPETGTFSSRDPAKDELNLYRYVRNNPVNSEDPSGLADTDYRDRFFSAVAAIDDDDRREALFALMDLRYPTKDDKNKALWQAHHWYSQKDSMANWVTSVSVDVQDVNEPKHVSLLPAHVHQKVTTEQTEFWRDEMSRLGMSGRLDYDELVKEMETLPTERQVEIFQRYAKIVSEQKLAYKNFLVNVDSSAEQVQKATSNAIHKTPDRIANNPVASDKYKKAQKKYTNRVIQYQEDIARIKEAPDPKLQPNSARYRRLAKGSLMILGVLGLLGNAKAVASPTFEQQKAFDDLLNAYRRLLRARQEGSDLTRHAHDLADATDRYLASVGADETQRKASLESLYSLPYRKFGENE